MSRYWFDEPGAPFAFTATPYVQAARILRIRRAAYFAACQANPWDDSAVRLALAEYEDALADVRREEEAAIADLRTRTHGPRIANPQPARFRS